MQHRIGATAAMKLLIVAVSVLVVGLHRSLPPWMAARDTRFDAARLCSSTPATCAPLVLVLPPPVLPQLSLCAAVVSVSAAEKKKPYYLPPASASMNAAFSTPYGTSGVSQRSSAH